MRATIVAGLTAALCMTGAAATAVATNPINGTQGDDHLVGTQSADRIKSFGGNDTVNGRDGDDRIQVGNGNDDVFAGDGSDEIIDGRGKDVIDAGSGPDRVGDRQGSDVFFLGTGNDSIWMDARHSRNDFVFCGPGDDIVIYPYPAFTDVDPTDTFHGCETVAVLD
jgi:Ca2+-binding RTX toxin-like protein